MQLFRLIFLLAVIAYLWLFELFDHTTHIVVGRDHRFEYNWLAMIMAFGFNVILIAAAWYLWRSKRNRWGAGIFLLGIPLVVVVVMPQLFMEWIEVTPAELVFRREPPHDCYNADIAWNDIALAVEKQYEAGVFSTYFVSSYDITMRDGRTFQLPANTVLNSARDTIDARLRERGIPVRVEVIRR
jgi:hypothetical protein